MRNWNDAGTVHFDQSTCEVMEEKTVDFYLLGVRVKATLLIPRTILRELRSSDWDAAESELKQNIFSVVQGMNRRGVTVNPDSFERAVKMQLCESLYNAFTLAQAAKGNQVWATPETMQDIGQRPEEDERYNVGNGVLQ